MDLFMAALVLCMGASAIVFVWLAIDPRPTVEDGLATRARRAAEAARGSVPQAGRAEPRSSLLMSTPAGREGAGS